jgi:hypothetical protein
MNNAVNFLDFIPVSLATAIFTTTFTGIVVYFLQKRIENKFARSLFEFQKKFSINHEKEIETLKLLYQKFLVLSKEFRNLSRRILNSSHDIKESQEEIEEAIENFWQEMNSYDEYFMENRIFLPNDTARKVASLGKNILFLAQ